MLESRKSDHIQINIEKEVGSLLTTGLENYHFLHQALPELDLVNVDTSAKLFNRSLKLPLLISSMTGGTAQAFEINRRLAIAAQETKIAMGLGSQRAALEHPEMAYTFQVRKFAPDIPLIANLGAVQLNYSYTIEHCQRVVDMVEADALFLHLNPLQEALQPEGDTRFSDLLKKIEMICKRISIPVIIKEIGWGISGETAEKLFQAGASGIDVAGAGGTSWSQVERYRHSSRSMIRIAEAFRDWGIPTALSIQYVKKAVPGLLLFASGGLKGGIDIAKSIALGADIGGMAGMFLKHAIKSEGEVIELINSIQKELQICMFVAGAADMHQLKNTPLINRYGVRTGE